MPKSKTNLQKARNILENLSLVFRFSLCTTILLLRFSCELCVSVDLLSLTLEASLDLNQLEQHQRFGAMLRTPKRNVDERITS